MAIAAPETTAAASTRTAAIDVECRGTPYEMGLAQGETLREKIHGTLRAVDQLEAFRLSKPFWLPFGLFRRLAEGRSRRFVEAACRWAASSFAERLRGIAEGAGVRREKIALVNVLEVVLSDLTGTTQVPCSAACSAVAIAGDEPVVAHNFDYLPLVQPFYVVRRCEPAGGFRSLEFTAAPLCGGIDGVNEAGLGVSYNYAYVTDSARPGPTISMLISEALARCRTVDEATERIGNAQPRRGGGNLTLADDAGNVAVLELSNTRSRLRRPTDGQHWVFATNRFRTAPMREVELDAAAIHGRRAPRALRGRRVHKSGEDRDRRLERLLRDSSPETPAELTRLMSDHGPDGEPSHGTICMHSDYWNTTASLQILPKRRCLRLAYDAACRAEHAELQLT